MHTIDARRRSLFWRIHFWAALIATPFALLAALTGIFYIFTPQIEAALYGHLDHVAAHGQMRALDDMVAAADAAAPAGMSLQSVQPPAALEDSAKLLYAPADAASEHAGHAGMAPPRKAAFGPPADGVVVYVDPYSLEVLGALAVKDRFNVWAKRLHSRLLQGAGWRWMIELAASWLMVMLVTGVALWWPRAGRRALPQPGARGRAAWRQWHGFLGVALGLISAVILTTGLTWSEQAGKQIRALRDLSGQGPAPAPAHLMSAPSQGRPALGWQGAWDAARREAPGAAMQMTAPALAMHSTAPGAAMQMTARAVAMQSTALSVAMQLTAPAMPEGVWRATSIDRSQPLRRFDLALDAFSGQRLYYSGWDGDTAFAKATNIGIPFHRGEFGWWNQVLLLLFGVGIVFSIVSGWMMFFKRRKRGLPWLPLLLPGAWRATSPLACLTALGMCALMPLLAASAAVLVVVELGLARGRLRTSVQGESPP